MAGNTREQLMEEALQIHNIIPGRDIDDPKRVQRVTLMSLDHLKEDDTAGDALEELLPKRSRKRNYFDEHNQPSTSEIPPKKPNKSPVLGDENSDIGTEAEAPRDMSVIDVSPHIDNTAIVSCHEENDKDTSIDDSDVVCIDVNVVVEEKKLAFYNSLIEVFPDADKDFVKAICNKCSQDANWLSNTITDLLENGYPKAAENSGQKQEDVSNEKHCNRRRKEDAVEEFLPKRSRKRNYVDEHNQPSTSGIPPKKQSKSPVLGDENSDIGTEAEAPRDMPIIDVSLQTDNTAIVSRHEENDKDISTDVINFTNRSDSACDISSEYRNQLQTVWESEELSSSSEDVPDLSSSVVVDPSTEPAKNVDPKESDELRNAASTSFQNPQVPRLDGNRSDDIVRERNPSIDMTLPGPSTTNFEGLLVPLPPPPPPPAQLDGNDVVCIDVNAVVEEKKLAFYNSLIEVFPDADKDFLKAICCNKCSQDANSLSNTITDLLENGYPKAGEDIGQKQENVSNEKHCEGCRKEEEKKIIIEENYNNLLAIFPNADPTYIRETCEQIADDEDAMKNFVSDTLESGKYPTLAEYQERMKIREIQEKYLKNFKIEEFLEIFPEPFKYFFEEKKNNQNDSELILNYLKSRYRKIHVKILQSCLMKNNYSLTKTCEELDKCRSFMKLKHGEHEIQYSEHDMKNIPFMQEVAFIENKEKIEAYLNEKKLIKFASFKRAKENNELLECGCCFDDEVLTEDSVTCGEGHIFCRSCLQKYAETQIGEGKTVFTCLSTCDAEFSLKALQGVLKPSVFSKMLQRKQLEEVKSAAIPGLDTCPFCDFASIPPEEDKVFRCLNPECMKESCRKCKEPSHIPLRCEEVEKPEEVKIRTYIEDRMTQALIRTCWRCEKKFIKTDGCNKMTCTCGAVMCYICRKPVKDYTHFNGEGGTEYHKCPLFSTNDDLHVKAVEEEATKARNEALAKNPNVELKHDPTHILPERTQPNVHYNGRVDQRVQQNFRIPGVYIQNIGNVIMNNVVYVNGVQMRLPAGAANIQIVNNEVYVNGVQLRPPAGEARAAAREVTRQ